MQRRMINQYDLFYCCILWINYIQFILLIMYSAEAFVVVVASSVADVDMHSYYTWSLARRRASSVNERIDTMNLEKGCGCHFKLWLRYL